MESVYMDEADREKLSIATVQAVDNELSVKSFELLVNDNETNKWMRRYINDYSSQYKRITSPIEQLITMSNQQLLLIKLLKEMEKEDCCSCTIRDDCAIRVPTTALKLFIPYYVNTINKHFNEQTKGLGYD